NTLRETIRNGLRDGQWDLKVGNKVYIKSEQDARTSIPDTIEFSDRLVLYRRGILQPPEPRAIELNAQVMAYAGENKENPVRVRWRAKGALKISLQVGSELIPDEFRPSDEYEVKITETTVFRLIADYGNGETAEQETKAIIAQPGKVKDKSNPYDISNGNGSTGSIFEYQSPSIELDGTVNKVFNDLADLIGDRKIKTVKSLEISVDQVIDYRKLGTTIPLLSRFPVSIEQTAMLQTGDDQFVKLEYQGQVKGFQSFFGTINSLLNNPATQANVNLKLIINFGDKPVASDGTELNTIQQALSRNPVERISLNVEVGY
ncbi:MAG: AAA family ATPase, partial [Cyanobacteria bacterium J06555_3]